MQARRDDNFINYNMYRQNIHIKTKCGQHTCKALSNHESFCSSQSHATVPLTSQLIWYYIRNKVKVWISKWTRQIHVMKKPEVQKSHASVPLIWSVLSSPLCWMYSYKQCCQLLLCALHSGFPPPPPPPILLIVNLKFLQRFRIHICWESIGENFHCVQCTASNFSYYESWWEVGEYKNWIYARYFFRFFLVTIFFWNFISVDFLEGNFLAGLFFLRIKFPMNV